MNLLEVLSGPLADFDADDVLAAIPPETREALEAGLRLSDPMVFGTETHIELWFDPGEVAWIADASFARAKGGSPAAALTNLLAQLPEVSA